MSQIINPQSLTSRRSEMDPKLILFVGSFAFGLISLISGPVLILADCLLKASPPDGWYTPIFDQVLSESLSGLTKSFGSQLLGRGGPKKICWTTKPRMRGVHAPGSVTYSCTYKDNIADQACLFQNIQKALNSPIFQLPSNIRLVILKTDNSTFLAISVCLAGTVETYTVLTTTNDGLPQEKMDEIKNMYASIGIKVKNTTEYDFAVKVERIKVDPCYEGANFNELKDSIKGLFNLGSN